MRIGIIGAGNIGGALTRRFRAAGHDVTVANSTGAGALARLVEETGAQAASVEDAVRGKEVVVVAIPLKAVGTLDPNLFAGAADDLIVIDPNNYYPQQRDGRLAEIEDGMVESAWVEQKLGRPVIKAFNMIIAPHLQGSGTAAGTPGRIALVVAGDQPEAKAKVMQLVDAIGFDAVDAGSIADSWRQQPGTPVYCKDMDVAGVRRALGEARHERAPEWRATPNSPGTYDKPA